MPTHHESADDDDARTPLYIFIRRKKNVWDSWYSHQDCCHVYDISPLSLTRTHIDRDRNFCLIKGGIVHQTGQIIIKSSRGKNNKRVWFLFVCWGQHS